MYLLLFGVITGHFTTISIYYLLDKFIIPNIPPSHYLYSFIIKLHTRTRSITSNLWILRFYLFLTWVIMLVSVKYLPYILKYIEYAENLI